MYSKESLAKEESLKRTSKEEKLIVPCECGKSIHNADAVFCTHCGKRLKREISPKKS